MEEDEGASSDPEALEGGAGSSDEGNDYGLGGDGASGSGSEGSGDEEEAAEEEAGCAGAPGILALASDDSEDGGSRSERAGLEGRHMQRHHHPACPRCGTAGAVQLRLLQPARSQASPQTPPPSCRCAAGGTDIDDDGAPSSEEGLNGEKGEEGPDAAGDEGDDEGDGEEEEEREPGSSDADDEGGASSSGSEGEGAARRGARAGHASFLAGEKGASFAKAFSKILEKPVKKAAVGGGAKARGGAELILAESAGVQKRKQEEEDDAAARHEAKKQRLAMRTRGHVVGGSRRRGPNAPKEQGPRWGVEAARAADAAPCARPSTPPPQPPTVPRKGEDPAHDVREKQLQRLATRGVVLLFNAVNKAQKQRAEAEAAGGVSKRKAAAAKLSKASFLAELKQAATKGVAVEAGAPGGAAAAADDAARGASWEVLGEGFPGLTRGAKMKDWDRRAGSDEDEVGEQPHLKGVDISSDEGDGW
jgi:hypothetical protein